MRPAWMVVMLLAWAAGARAQTDVEPPEPPDFQGRYTVQPTAPPPAPRANWLEWVDVGALVIALSAASWLALKRRSRRGMVILTLLSLGYFGFYRKGCVCAVGAVQNVSLALFGSGYAVPLTVVAFFLLPLLFTLAFGRTFCASVCPLGAVQELVLIRPMRIAAPVRHALGVLPWVYLAAAVTLAATGSAFIICRYDPFVSLFRLSGPANLVALTGLFVILSAFIGRPYCRFLCPYGAILGCLSVVSKWHASITPDECIRCRLCSDACPYDAITAPTPPAGALPRGRGKANLVAMLLLGPVLVAAGGFGGGLLAGPLARVHPVVQRAERLRLADTGQAVADPVEIDAIGRTQEPAWQLYARALAVRRRFDSLWSIGPVRVGWAHLMGAFVGLVVGVKLLRLSVRRTQEDYLPDRAACVSCARCFSHCPRERLRRDGPPAERDQP